MTGYGRGEHTAVGDARIVVELKGVNHRYLEVSVRLPKGWMGLEPLIVGQVKRSVSRGKIDVMLNANTSAIAVRKPFVSEPLAREYLKIGQELAENLGIDFNLGVKDILRLPEVMSFPEEVVDVNVLWNIVRPALESSLEGFLASKSREGNALGEDMLGRRERLSVLVSEVRELHAGVVKGIADRLRKRIAQLLEDTEVDENRIIQEAAFLADREDISEELVRLSSHLEQFSRIVAKEPPVGKELDFVLQEMLREVNTSCAKSSCTDITHKLLATGCLTATGLTLAWAIFSTLQHIF